MNSIPFEFAANTCIQLLIQQLGKLSDNQMNINSVVSYVQVQMKQEKLVGYTYLHSLLTITQKVLVSLGAYQFTHV